MLGLMLRHLQVDGGHLALVAAGPATAAAEDEVVEPRVSVNHSQLGELADQALQRGAETWVQDLEVGEVVLRPLSLA